MHAAAAEILVKDGRAVGASATYGMHSFVQRPPDEYLQAGRERMAFLRAAMAVQGLESDDARLARPAPVDLVEEYDSMNGQGYIIAGTRDEPVRQTPLEPPMRSSGLRYEVGVFLGWVSDAGPVEAVRALWHLRIAPRLGQDEWVDLTEHG